MRVCVVDYSLETLTLSWIQPRESAVQFDPGGEDDSQFIINEFVLKNCSFNSSDGPSQCCFRLAAVSVSLLLQLKFLLESRIL